LPGMLGSLAGLCQIAALSANHISFTVNAENTAFLSDRNVERLGELLSEYFGETLVVTVDIGDTSHETPAAYKQRCLDERLVVARHALRSDFNVKRIIEEFDGVLDDESVHLVD
jgi:DNA polymerase-3 subunit gamma/tau